MLKIEKREQKKSTDAFHENIGFGLKVACASEEKLRETVHADQFGGPQLRGLVPASC